jgi:1,4-dihydroxy-2-naphthoate octaprenyltransferase
LVQTRAPRTTFQALLLLIRAELTLALVMPVLVGGILAWWERGRFDPVALALAASGMALTGWGFATLRDFADYRYGLRARSKPVPDPVHSGFGLMQRALLRPQTVRDVGLILLTIGALCSLWLVMMADWPVLFFSGLSFIVICVIILLPLRYGSRGWGLGEAGILLGLGLLPLLGSYYGQAHLLTGLPVWVGLPFSLLTALLFFNYNAVHFRRDWLLHKRTLTVNLGLARALDLSALLTVVAHVGILLVVTLTNLPLLALLALSALPMGLGVFARLERDHLTTEGCLQLYQTNIQAAVIAAGLFCAALLIDKLL